MSFELTQKVLRNRLNISPCEKLLLAILADKIDHKGFCYPSYNTLAKLTNYCRRHVIRGIKNLVKHNLIIVTKIIGTGNQYIIDEKVLDKMIDEVKKGESTGDIMSLALVSGSHPPSDILSPPPCQDVTLVNKVVNKEVDKGSKVISKNKITKSNSGSKEGVGEQMKTIIIKPSKNPLKAKVIDEHGSIEYEVSGEEMKIEDLDIAKFQKTYKKKMNPIDIWRNAVVDFQNEHLLAVVDLKFTQVQAGIMNKVAKKLEGRFKDSLEHAVWNWGKFVKYVLLHAGGTDKPLSPNIHFFVFHSNLALLFFQKKIDTKIKPKKIKVTKKTVTDAHTKALLKAVGKLSGD